MGSVLLEQIKKQTTTFINEKYKSARITFTDVSEAELLAEETTNKDDCSPDAKTMTRIAEACFEIDDYWRIVDVLHRRLYNVDWEQWRQSYKTLVLLEFLITHGPEEFAQEFQPDAEIIEELGCFTLIDEKGFNWGARMQKLSDRIVKLLQGGEDLMEARLKALKITNEIQGFGCSLNSPSSSLSSSPFSSSSSSPTSILSTKTNNYFDSNNDDDVKKKHYQGVPVIDQERHVLIDSNDDDGNNNNVKKSPQKGFVSGICSKIIGGRSSNYQKIGFRCISDVGRKEVNKKKYDRQYSLWF